MPRPPGAANLLLELASLERSSGALSPARLREAILAVIERLEKDGSASDVQSVLTFCRTMYSKSRSIEAIPAAQAALACARRLGDMDLIRQTATACGTLAADGGDLVDALEHHAIALRAAFVGDESEAIARAWNMTGLALGIGGHYELAMRCYERALERLRPVAGPNAIRIAVLSNLADAYCRQGLAEPGLKHGYAALAEVRPEHLVQDSHNILLLHRTMVLLHVGAGQAAEAKVHVERCRELAADVESPRAKVALALARASYELGCGHYDIALSLLQAVLEQARTLPSSLRDILIAIARAEEAGGHPERAMLRVNELSQHIYHSAIASVRAHRELAGLPLPVGNLVEREQQQSRARLISRLKPATPPDAWPMLCRMAMSACLALDPSGLHGKRVGALVRGLALAAGLRPLEALEMGLAAELHDIGLASVPPGILRKKEPLEPHEQMLFDQHVPAGMDLLADDSHPRMLLAREMVQYHHAHWDGSGKPADVRGNRIPMGARLCAIADAYDSMLNGIHFPGRVSMKKGLAALRRDSGRRFDPDLVERFQELIRDRSDDLGVDLESEKGTRGFRALIQSLHEDQGFV